MIITDLTWLKKFVNIACFQIYKIISNLCVVDQLSVVTSGRIRPLTSKDLHPGLVTLPWWWSLCVSVTPRAMPVGT